MALMNLLMTHTRANSVNIPPLPHANQVYAVNSSDSAAHHQVKEHNCSPGDLLGPVGLFVQALLAFLAFTSLIVKRYCEPQHSRRPWKIWFFDTSKQALGAAVIHFANVFLADIFHGDPCTWYFVSFLLDSTVGLFIIYIGLKVTQIAAQRYKWTTLQFGEYGKPPQCQSWVGQCGLYIIVMIIEKILMTLLVLFPFWTSVRKFIMKPIQNGVLELVIVMFLVPLVINAFIFWVVDNFLKKSIQNSKTIYVNDNDTSVKYYKTSERVKCYNRIEQADGFESDILLSADEETEARHRNADATQLLLDT
ncbi:store-operated calcium entry regulator STIMATE-like [Gigantopelta aegis]|uniref:store-operated calcium entry regulator STIMATE-like n=1 Tax=Gigantopelta aegis TaxID=1735272 RepID=UPI001B88E431|nr:store-operated calcium entry regulator STIMATE-like [Gigantopelta aegis]